MDEFVVDARVLDETADPREEEESLERRKFGIAVWLRVVDDACSRGCLKSVGEKLVADSELSSELL